MAIYATNVSAFSFRIMAANSLLLISSIFWVIDKAFAIKYLFHLSFFSINHMSVLKKVRKSIFRTMFILLSANKKVSSKNQTFLSLS